MEMMKLDYDEVRQAIQQKSAAQQHYEMANLQIVVYTMAGGGMLGRFAAEQPADFYIDSRVAKRPYPTKAIYQAVKVLSIYAEILGLKPNDLPRVLDFHNCGIF